MSLRASFASLAAVLLVPAALGCNSASVEPIGKDTSSSTTGSSSTGGDGGGGSSASSMSTATGSEGGSAPCSPACNDGAACVDGTCHAITTLDTDSAAAMCAIVLDDKNVYWTASNLRRVAKAGGASTFLDFGSATQGLLVDDTYLYWTNLGVLRAKKDVAGTPGTPAGEPYAAEGGSPRHLVSDGTTIFYDDAGVVYEAPLDGTPAPQAAATPFSEEWSTGAVTPIAVDATSVYMWTEGGVVLTKVSKANPNSSTNIGHAGLETVTSASAVIIDGADVWFSTVPVPGSGGQIAKAASPSAAVVVDGSAGAMGPFAIDATYLYFVTPAGVSRVQKSGGTPVELVRFATPTTFPSCVAVDDSGVYFVDGGDLRRLAK